MINACRFVVTAGLTLDVDKNVTATVNSSVTLTCEIETGPALRWYLYPNHQSGEAVKVSDKVHVAPGFRRFTVRTDAATGHSKLMISNVHYEDAGQYQCQTVNDGQSTFYVVQLIVHNATGKQTKCKGPDLAGAPTSWV